MNKIPDTVTEDQKFEAIGITGEKRRLFEQCYGPYTSKILEHCYKIHILRCKILNR